LVVEDIKAKAKIQDWLDGYASIHPLYFFGSVRRFYLFWAKNHFFIKKASTL